MATLQIDPKLPEITPAQSLTGWRREFCIELLGDAGAKIFVRTVEEGSFKAGGRVPWANRFLPACA